MGEGILFPIFKVGVCDSVLPPYQFLCNAKL